MLAGRTSVQRPCFRMSRQGMTLDCLAVKGAAMDASPGFTMLLACLWAGGAGRGRQRRVRMLDLRGDLPVPLAHPAAFVAFCSVSLFSRAA